MAKVASIYLDGTYAGHNQQFGDDNASWKAGFIQALLADRGVRPETVCEVGCGGGGILVELAERLPEARELVGFEPMPEAFAQAEGRTSERLRFVNGSYEEHRGDPFDLALCIDVFEHVEDCFEFLRGMRPLAKQFVFHIPLDMNTQMVLRGKPIMHVRNSVGHIHYFSKDTAIATLEDTGYEVLEHRYVAGANERSTRLKSRLLRLPRSVLFRLSNDFAARLLGGYSLLVFARPAN